MHGTVDKVEPHDVTVKVSESFPPTLRKLQGLSGCYVFDDAEGAAALLKSETGSKNCSGRLK